MWWCRELGHVTGIASRGLVLVYKQWIFCVIVLATLGSVTRRLANYAYVVNVPSEQKTPTTIRCWVCDRQEAERDVNSTCGAQPERSEQCAEGQTWCQTVHRLDVREAHSTLLLKRCVTPSPQCAFNRIGCHPTNQIAIHECISCCSQDLCNQENPQSKKPVKLQSTSYANTNALVLPSILLINFTLYVCICLIEK